MAAQLLRRLFTVEEFYQMAQAGILTEDDRVELLDGELVEMTPIGSRHAACVKQFNKLFSRHTGESVLVGVQDPIRIGKRSEPQPDLTLLRFRSDCYAQAHPEPEDVLLVVEVAETSVEVDREIKIPLYAQAGIPEVWLVNLIEKCVEVYRSPSPQGYGDIRQVQSGQYLSPLELPDAVLAVDDVLL